MKSIMIMALVLLCGCSAGNARSGDAQTASSDAKPRIEAADFDQDSAFAQVAAQVAMGPRVPGSPAQDRCAAYLAKTLRGYGADSVSTLSSTVTVDGKHLPAKNIFARFVGNKPGGKKVILLAHWDSRPWADNDPDEANHDKPIDGANDGASGVGVILELARQFSLKRPDVTVDILLCDAEDSGSTHDEDSWALGTQKWVASDPYPTLADRPAYGILLDMVGGENARFHREYFSDRAARHVVDKVWATAAAIGEADRFVNASGGAITDDHIHLNGYGIPTIDIIESLNPQTRGFNPTWHTVSDNINHIDRATLGAVGRVVATTIYNESAD